MGIFHMVIGAASFWLPDILTKVFTGNGTAWPLITVIMPAICFGVYFRIQRAMRADNISVAAWTLAGIYFFGPLFMLATATLGGAGLHTIRHADYWFIPVQMFFPPFTLMLSGYDQSFFALIIVTVGFAIIHLTASAP